MSRSYKKPYITDNGRHRIAAKKDAVKTMRKKDIYNGNYYKKIYCSWNISDYNWYDPTNKKAYRK